MKEPIRQHHIDGLFVLLSFGVYAVLVLLVLLTGAKSYRSQVARDQQSWDSRTGLQYVAAKLRHADEKDAVSLSGEEDGGYKTLELTETIEGERYTTSIYCDDGYIRELFTLSGNPFLPEDGEKVMPVQQLRFYLDDDGQLRVKVVDVNGNHEAMMLYLRGGEVRLS